jgi:hypothetical protein
MGIVGDEVVPDEGEPVKEALAAPGASKFYVVR